AGPPGTPARRRRCGRHLVGARLQEPRTPRAPARIPGADAALPPGHGAGPTGRAGAAGFHQPPGPAHPAFTRTTGFMTDSEPLNTPESALKVDVAVIGGGPA